MKVTFVVEPFFLKNRIFSLTDPVANRDNCQAPFARLRTRLSESGISIDTQDITPVSDANAVLFLNAPRANNWTWHTAIAMSIPIHVLALESEYIHAPNGDRSLLDQCKSVFTYRDDWVDGVRYFPIRYAQGLHTPKRWQWKNRKFACMLAGNKWSHHADELYSARKRVIDWYQSNAPERFSLFGPGWEMPTPKSFMHKVFRRIPGLRECLAPNLSVWRGQVNSKAETIAGYRFCYCFENFSGPSGWVTEKIFDAMLAGAIPVYWGHPDTSRHIPSACYVDAARFSSIEALDTFLRQMSDSECSAMQASVSQFLTSQDAREFSIDTFVATIAGRLEAEA
ncbi:MAG TPA: glycosyltransferase family 10 [Methylophilaceae bacterium]|jgi:hypothetical protein|nr:glycosyltransferase family 10 [Methylophilaceae bacterium]